MLGCMHDNACFFVDGSALLSDVKRAKDANPQLRDKKLHLGQLASHFVAVARRDRFINGYRRFVYYFADGDQRVEKSLLVPEARPALRMKNKISRDAVVRGLRAALIAHREGRVLDIHSGWDDAAALDHDDDNVSIALNLWEGWADSAAHQWLYYEGLCADDWPRIANIVIDALERDREIEDPEVLRHFVLRLREPSTLTRLVARISRLFRSG